MSFIPQTYVCELIKKRKMKIFKRCDVLAKEISHTWRKEEKEAS